METDADANGEAEIIVEYEKGLKVRQRENQGGEGAAGRLIVFDEKERPLRIEEETGGPEQIRTVQFFEEGVHRRTERDADGDGRPEVWIHNDPAGQIVRREEDRDQDGQADFIAYFDEGIARRVHQKTADSECFNLRSWLDPRGRVLAEEKDQSGNCQMDTWNYYRGDRLERQGRDSSGDGKADLLLRFDKALQIVQQELRSEGAHPDTKIFLDGVSGTEIRRCVDSGGDGKLDLLILREGDALSETILDLDQDGQGDQRDVYGQGRRTRVEIDTNADTRPDVVQTLDEDGETVMQQDEDSDYDGRMDRRFVGDQPAELPDRPAAPGKLPSLDCGRFDSFWNNH